MRHTAALSDQFPVTAYIASIILNNPSATADVQEKFLATYREVLNHYRVIKNPCFPLSYSSIHWEPHFSLPGK